MASDGILTDDMKRVVREQRLGYAATVCADGTPNLSPKGTTTVWDDQHLVFADIRSPGTVENVERNPAIEVNVVDPVTRKGYRFKGTASVVTSGPLFDEIAAFYEGDDDEARRAVAGRMRAFVLVRVERARPLVSPGYDDGTPEEEIARKWEHYYRSLRRER